MGRGLGSGVERAWRRDAPDVSGALRILQSSWRVQLNIFSESVVDEIAVDEPGPHRYHDACDSQT